MTVRGSREILRFLKAQPAGYPGRLKVSLREKVWSRLFTWAAEQMELPSAEVRKAVVVGGRRQIFIFEGKEQVFIFGNDEPEYFVRHLSGDFK